MASKTLSNNGEEMFRFWMEKEFTIDGRTSLLKAMGVPSDRPLA
jgi:hypothetical protein